MPLWSWFVCNSLYLYRGFLIINLALDLFDGHMFFHHQPCRIHRKTWITYVIRTRSAWTLEKLTEENSIHR